MRSAGNRYARDRTAGGFTPRRCGRRSRAVRSWRGWQHVIVVHPEYGYAVRNLYPGAGTATVIGEQVTWRSGEIIYAGVTIGDATTIERGTHIGDEVRMSPGSHL